MRLSLLVGSQSSLSAAEKTGTAEHVEDSLDEAQAGLATPSMSSSHVHETQGRIPKCCSGTNPQHLTRMDIGWCQTQEARLP